MVDHYHPIQDRYQRETFRGGVHHGLSMHSSFFLCLWTCVAQGTLCCHSHSQAKNHPKQTTRTTNWDPLNFTPLHYLTKTQFRLKWMKHKLGLPREINNPKWKKVKVGEGGKEETEIGNRYI